MSENRSWWLPASFKEVGACALSAMLIGLFWYALMKTYGLIGALPQSVSIGDTFEVIDSYSRAKDLLNVLFPLFSAVVTFWLGVAVERRRADEYRNIVDQERKSRAGAEERESVTKRKVAVTIGRALDHAEFIREATEPQRMPERTHLDNLVNILREGKQSLD